VPHLYLFAATETPEGMIPVADWAEGEAKIAAALTRE
jgi:hypothetical protein